MTPLHRSGQTRCCGLFTLPPGRQAVNAALVSTGTQSAMKISNSRSFLAHRSALKTMLPSGPVTAHPQDPDQDDRVAAAEGGSE